MQLKRQLEKLDPREIKLSQSVNYWSDTYLTSGSTLIEYFNYWMTRSGIIYSLRGIDEDSIPAYPGFKKNFYASVLKSFLARKTDVLKGTYGLIHNPWCPGYYHWMCEALPRLEHLLMKYSKEDFEILLPRSFKNRTYVQDSLQSYGVGIKWFSDNNNLKVDHLITASNVKRTGAVDPKLLGLVRQRIMHQSRSTEGIYVTRRSSGRRLIINESEVVELLSNYGIKTYDFDCITFRKQIEIMSQAKTFVSIHGAALANALFMKEKGLIVEMQLAESKTAYSPLYYYLSEYSNSRYEVLFCNPGGDDKNIYTANLHVDICRLKNILEGNSN